MGAQPAAASRAAAWAVGAAVLAHLAVGASATQVAPAAASTSAVSLVDDRNGAALFSATGLHPGRTETACVALSVAGSTEGAGEVSLSADVTVEDLAPYLLIGIERGTLADPTSCATFSGASFWTGTLAQLPRSAATGVPTGWRVADQAQTVYRFTVTVLDDPQAQGRAAAAAFVWTLDLTPPPPGPEPEPEPQPGPDGEPQPEPEPEPAPVPTPVASPSAAPVPDPEPTATPSARPAAPPIGTVSPTPTPTPAPPSGTPSEPPAAGGPGGAGPPGAGDVVQAPPLQGFPATVQEVVAAVGATALAVVEDGQFPLALVAVVVAFLFVQGQLDRRDPKLALAPVRQDLNDFQDFPSMPRTRT